MIASRLLLAAWLSLAAFADALANEPLQARLDVLLELGEAGVVDAWYELADLALAHPDVDVLDGERGLQYLALSAASGRGSAVRWLAYRLLREFGHYDEAATLIAVSALLGDERAAMDLRLWPKLTPVDTAAMTAGFDAAVARLSGGGIVDCDALPFDCLPATERIAAIDPADVLRAGRLAERGPWTEPAAMFALFEHVYSSYDAFPEARFREFKDQQRAANRALRAGPPGGDPVTDALDFDERAYVDRQRRRAADALEYLRTTRRSDLERYRERIEQALQRINRHRADGDRIEPADVIRAIGEERS